MTELISSARASPVGKDPPMQENISPEIRHLCREAIDDPVKRLDFLNSLDRYVQDLRDRGHDAKADAYLAGTIDDLRVEAANARKNKSRTYIRLVSKLFGPALIMVLTKALTDHLPFV